MHILVLFTSSSGSCSTHPALGMICRCSIWCEATTLTSRSNSMNRVDCVPWSMAPTNASPLPVDMPRPNVRSALARRILAISSSSTTVHRSRPTRPYPKEVFIGRVGWNPSLSFPPNRRIDPPAPGRDRRFDSDRGKKRRQGHEGASATPTSSHTSVDVRADGSEPSRNGHGTHACVACHPRSDVVDVCPASCASTNTNHDGSRRHEIAEVEVLFVHRSRRWSGGRRRSRRRWDVHAPIQRLEHVLCLGVGQLSRRNRRVLHVHCDGAVDAVIHRRTLLLDFPRFRPLLCLGFFL
mmetsp:Transcript_3525/g.22172  ORF Transcript_3525/g.22172 Transcript_3525/m.22172 type:complete len:295 (+) Transcript_3525:1450-2334(+)